MHQLLRALILVWLLASWKGAAAQTTEPLSASVGVVSGPVNGVFVQRDGRVLAVYGDPTGTLPQADMVLLTHNRRDVIWAGRDLIDRGAQAVVPASEAETFTNADDFWKNWADARFHDYRQQTTKLPLMALRIDRTVKDGDAFQWQDLTVKVLGTPGYTRGAVTYLLEVDGVRYAFVGDAIYADGKILDLYSLQDEVTEAQIGGYHGYAGRIGDLIASLRRIAQQRPDVLIPARGPVIRDPQAAITRLIARLQAAYANYLSINAGRWYFRDRYDILARRALGPAGRVDWMPWATTIDETPPTWMVCIQNSRLILSDSGAGWLIDCGSRGIIDEVVKLRDTGRLKSLDGLFVTHYHDDHTNSINALLETFPCPVYVTPLMADVLKHPAAYRLPAMTAHAVEGCQVLPDRHTMQWREFKLTFYDYPGQTLYHDAMLAEHPNGEKIFFLGDSLTPSGLDDYCLLNRNVLHEGQGYFYCLDLLQTLPADCLLVNQHVMPAFHFQSDQLTQMRTALTKRKTLLAALLPWDEPNYGIDERWARIHPYGQIAQPGQSAEIEVRILNHSDRRHAYTVTPHVPDGLTVRPERAEITIQPGEEKPVVFKVVIDSENAPSVAVITADIAFDQWDLRQWCDALVDVRPQ